MDLLTTIDIEHLNFPRGINKASFNTLIGRCFLPVAGQPLLPAGGGRGARSPDEPHARRLPSWVRFRGAMLI